MSKHIPIKDPGSSVTHGIGFILTVIGAVPLLTKAYQNPSPIHWPAMLIFILSMALLYGASASYHTFDISPEVNRRLQKLDHMSIYILIAGSYTPVCLIALGGTKGAVFCGIVWGLACLGCIFNALWISCPKWLSSILYIGMGWIVVFAVREIRQALGLPAFLWLLIGGIIYTVGGIIYALKLPIFNSRHENFGSHEIFHLFVMGGSFCHFMMMYLYLA